LFIALPLAERRLSVLAGCDLTERPPSTCVCSNRCRRHFRPDTDPSRGDVLRSQSWSRLSHSRRCAVTRTVATVSFSGLCAFISACTGPPTSSAAGCSAASGVQAHSPSQPSTRLQSGAWLRLTNTLGQQRSASQPGRTGGRGPVLSRFRRAGAELRVAYRQCAHRGADAVRGDAHPTVRVTARRSNLACGPASAS
jgi:hypothetical protein